MSRFLCEKYKELIPYTPGEQPRGGRIIKLNTNESPFPPSEKAIKKAAEAAKRLNLYPDPECRELRESMAKLYNVSSENVLMTNGSDEILNFAFMAFCSDKTGAAFPDITYGFYKVFADINNICYTEIPLDDKLCIRREDYFGINKTVFIANPNAPTGIALKIGDIEDIIKNNPENVVVIDEAYIDFGGESAVSLIDKYENLLVTMTFSKSRSMAGARLGAGIASKGLIEDLDLIKYSTNPYNINSMTMAAGIGALSDGQYTKANAETIKNNREYTKNELIKAGFSVIPSDANFVFAKHNDISGEKLYQELKKRGILVRHFAKERIKDYNRITIGTREQMEEFIKTTKTVLEENI